MRGLFLIAFAALECAAMVSACASDQFSTIGVPDAAPEADPPLDAQTTDATRADAGDTFDGSPSCTATPCVVEIVSGGTHTCARIADGGVRCWGNNGRGELGISATDGSLVDPKWTSAPTAVDGLPAARGIALSSLVGPALDGATTDESFGCALLASGIVACWGGNHDGTLGRGDGGVPAGDDDAHAPAPVNNLSGVVQIGAGSHHACAVLVDGGVACWGNGIYGQLARVTSGHDDLARPIGPLPDGRRATRVAGGALHTCAILDDATLACWGWNAVGQLAQPDAASIVFLPARVPDLTGVTGVSLGWTHTCVVAQGDVFCWGDERFGALGHLAVDGSSVRAEPVRVTLPGGKRAIDVSAGYFFTCALLEDATVACWGNNAYGGAGASAPTVLLPTIVPGLSNVVQVSAGLFTANTACALTAGGAVKCWGSNTYGQLGSGAGIMGGRDSLAHPFPQDVVF